MSNNKDEIKKCFVDTYMQTEGETELFDIEETITKLQALIDRKVTEARVDERKIAKKEASPRLYTTDLKDSITNATIKGFEDALSEVRQLHDDRLATLTNNNKEEE